MDITKRFDRILNLFFLLQSKAVVTLEEMQDRFNISERTIYRDLKALEAAGVPVLNEAGSGYSIMEGFRMQPTRFSEEEMLSLVVAEKIMQKHETQFIKYHFDAALIKIKSSFRYHQKNALLHLEDKLQFNERAKTADYLPNVLDVLLNSILRKKTACIQYIKHDEEHPTVRKIEAVGVFYESNNWYVAAWCHLRKEYRKFRLDRIKKIDLLNESFTLEHPPIEELKKQNEPEVKHHITVKVEKAFARNLHWDREIFGFYKEETDGDFVWMHFRSRIEHCYFVRWFMMFADIGEIVEPIQLQEELMGNVQNILNKKKRAV